MSDISPEQALSAALAAAEAASNSLTADYSRNRRGQNLEAWMKSPGALVTEADLAADRAIATSLADSGLDAALLSEESSSGDSSGDATWLVDPLCGTVPFRAGMPHWGVNIAMRKEAELIAGVIALPHSDRVLAATAGGDVTLNGDRFEAQDPNLPLNESVVGLEVDGGAEWTRLIGPDANGRSKLSWPGSISHTNTFASAAYPISLVATGAMSGVVFYKIDSVHLAAGALIAQEAGVIVSDERGQPLDWRSEEPYPIAVLAWPSVHAELIAALRG